MRKCNVEILQQHIRTLTSQFFGSHAALKSIPENKPDLFTSVIYDKKSALFSQFAYFFK